MMEILRCIWHFHVWITKSVKRMREKNCSKSWTIELNNLFAVDSSRRSCRCIQSWMLFLHFSVGTRRVSDFVTKYESLQQSLNKVDLLGLCWVESSGNWMGNCFLLQFEKINNILCLFSSDFRYEKKVKSRGKKIQKLNWTFANKISLERIES